MYHSALDVTAFLSDPSPKYAVSRRIRTLPLGAATSREHAIVAAAPSSIAPPSIHAPRFVV
jgi:hypothetical protein